MAKIKCVFSYDGTHFSGLQTQPHVRTVQGELEKALTKIHKGTHIPVYPSGRTDRGVHAKAQTAHFEPVFQLSPIEWKRALNSMLPADIFVAETAEVPASFHARFDVVEKEYRYYILNETEPDVFRRNYLFHFPHQLDVTRMQEAGHYLEGTHDFTTFASAKADIKGGRVRTLYDVSCQQDGGEIVIIVRGDGFLYNMVRIIAGTLLDSGRGRLEPSSIADMLAQKDRRFGGDTLPPQGLYLWQVTYDDTF
ncbi:tRNA pseudouridine(38-40) synthase TruA [Barrientosiimonas marina]|uniref:tRNA pseudouridine synthase A n=1 Tax=Lentibacillus kimchii TaxID=1542911 RepID=A0ABW2UTU7_9BACI